MAHGRGLEPRAQGGVQTAPRRVDDRELRGSGQVCGGRGGVVRQEAHGARAILRQSHRPGGVPRRGHGLLRDLRAHHLAPRPGHVQREAADAAVQVPHARGAHGVHPLRHLPVQLLGHGRVGLEEGARPHAQVDPVEAHDQLALLAQQNLLGALDHRLVLGLDVHGDHVRRGHQLAQQAQVLPNLGQLAGAAQHEAHHEPPLGVAGDDHVLDLAAALRDVVGQQPHPPDELRERVQGARDGFGVQRAVPEVHARGAVQDAERGRPHLTGHHHLGLVAEPPLRRGHRLQPPRRTVRVHELPHQLLLAGQLPRVRDFDHRAGPALTPVVVSAFHPPECTAGLACRARRRRTAGWGAPPPCVARARGSWHREGIRRPPRGPQP